MGRLADRRRPAVLRARPVEYIATASEVFPHHHTLLLRGAGHYIQEDAADEIVAAIADWWSTEVRARSEMRA